MGRVLSASLALNAPASLFFLRDGVLPVIWKTGRWERTPFLSREMLARFLTSLGEGKPEQKKHKSVFSATCYLSEDDFLPR